METEKWGAAGMATAKEDSRATRERLRSFMILSPFGSTIDFGNLLARKNGATNGLDLLDEKAGMACLNAFSERFVLLFKKSGFRKTYPSPLANQQTNLCRHHRWMISDVDRHFVRL